MSQTLKIRTFSDRIRSGVYHTIIATRKAGNSAAKLSKSAKDATITTYKETKSTAKLAWNTKL